jgi:hypothetical protein
MHSSAERARHALRTDSRSMLPPHLFDHCLQLIGETASPRVPIGALMGDTLGSHVQEAVHAITRPHDVVQQYVPDEHRITTTIRNSISVCGLCVRSQLARSKKAQSVLRRGRAQAVSPVGDATRGSHGDLDAFLLSCTYSG